MTIAWNRKVSDDTLREAYAEYRNIKVVAKVVGLCHQSVHDRLHKLGIKTPPSHHKGFFSADEDARLRADYVRYADEERLADLAKEMARPKTTIARRARELGITNGGKGRRRLKSGVWKYMDEKQASILWERFKNQNKGMGAFCRHQGISELGFWRTMTKFFPDEYEHALELKTPKTSLYRLGRALEYRVRDFLREQHGFFVMRSPASRSPIDLVAIRPHQVVFIQCKRAGALGVKEWNELLALARSVNATAILAIRHETGRGMRFYRLLDFKDGSKRSQPMAPWHPDTNQVALFNEQE